MPLDPASVSAIMQESLAANAIAGVSSPQLASGVAVGLSTYANSGLFVTTVDVGTLGVGIGTGTGFVLATPILVGAFLESFSANGILGVFAPALADALALGFTQAFASAIINTLNSTVGVGTGIVTAIPDPAASVPAFIAGFASAGIAGVFASPLAEAIAIGLDQSLPSGKGAVIIAGASSIYPSTGVGTGKLS